MPAAASVCANPTPLSPSDPTCVPYNPFGVGVNSQAAIDYITETGWANQELTQDVVALSASRSAVLFVGGTDLARVRRRTSS